jgi:hypothetical protein
MSLAQSLAQLVNCVGGHHSKTFKPSLPEFLAGTTAYYGSADRPPVRLAARYGIYTVDGYERRAIRVCNVETGFIYGYEAAGDARAAEFWEAL